MHGFGEASNVETKNSTEESQSAQNEDTAEVENGVEAGRLVEIWWPAQSEGTHEANGNEGYPIKEAHTNTEECPRKRLSGAGAWRVQL